MTSYQVVSAHQLNLVLAFKQLLPQKWGGARRSNHKNRNNDYECMNILHTNCIYTEK